MSIKLNPFVKVVEEVVIDQGPPRRHRAFPTGVRLPNDDILVGYRVGSDHHMTSDGAFHITRSSDNGRHWTLPKVLAAYPGWDVCATMGQYADGILPDDEPFLWVRLQLYRWLPNPSDEQDYRETRSLWTVSYDNGHNWEVPFPLYDNATCTVKTDKGEMLLAGGLSPHSYGTTLVRTSDGTIMGLFVGNRELMPYKTDAQYQEQERKDQSVKAGAGISLAGFSKDNLRTWEFVVIADSDEYGIGFSESDIVRLDSGRLLAIFGNNGNSEYFWRTYSDDEGRTWAPMKQLTFRGDCPSMLKLSDDVLLAAFRHLPDVEESPGVGLVASVDGGQTWDVLGHILDQTSYDMAYPDLIKLPDDRILCLYYTAPESILISSELEEELEKIEPMNTLASSRSRMPAARRRTTKKRPHAYEELDGQIRCTILEDLTCR